jgi:hypothetical protein
VRTLIKRHLTPVVAAPASAAASVGKAAAEGK